MNTETKSTNQIKILKYFDNAALLSAVFTILYFVILFQTGKMNLNYDTGMIQSIVNGNMIGYPHPHTLFINYILSTVISTLYKWLPMWNWFSFFILFAIYFSLWALLYRVLSLIGNGSILKRIAGGALTVYLFNLFFYEYLMSIYFSNCSFVAGACLFFYLFTAKKLRRRDVVICVILAVLCAGTRFSIFQEVIPFLVIAVAAHFFVFRSRKNLITFCASMLIVIGLMYIVEGHAYTGIYANEKELNHYRAAIQDYKGLPSFKDHAKFYKSLGMYQLEYSVMRNCWGLSDHLNKETLSAILDYTNAELADADTKQEQSLSMLSDLFKKDYTAVFWFMEILSIAAALILIGKRKDWRMLLCYLMVFLIVIGEVIYLINKGRMPVRTTITPLLILMFTGTGYVLRYRSEFLEIFRKRFSLLVTGILLLVICAAGTAVDTAASYQKYEEQYVKINKSLKIAQYILNDSENTYFIHGLYEDLDFYAPVKRNYTGWGGWISETVDWRTMLLGEYDNVWDAIAYRQDLRFVINGYSLNAIKRCLKKYGYHCTLVREEVDIDGNGTIFNFWRCVPGDETEE